MKDAPIAPAAGKPAFDWTTSMWPALLGVGGVAIAAMYGMGLFGKDGKKMTKLEKACVALLVALGEKVEELEKRKTELADELSETDRKLIAETRRAESAEAKTKDALRKLEQAENRVTETIQRVDAAEARVREVEAQFEDRIRELETQLRERPSRKSHRR